MDRASTFVFSGRRHDGPLTSHPSPLLKFLDPDVAELEAVASRGEYADAAIGALDRLRVEAEAPHESHHLLRAGDRRHPEADPYRCYLSILAGFGKLSRAGPARAREN